MLLRSFLKLQEKKLSLKDGKRYITRQVYRFYYLTVKFTSE